MGPNLILKKKKKKEEEESITSPLHNGLHKSSIGIQVLRIREKENISIQRNLPNENCLFSQSLI